MPEIPKEQWAQVIEKTGGPVEYKKIPVQEPGPDEVLVNIKYSGVCHTDLHAVNGDWPLVSSTLEDSQPHDLTLQSPPNFLLSVVTRVPVLLSQRATLSTTSRLV